VCKVTKNTLMRRAIDGDSAWSNLDSLLTGTNAFVLIKGDVGAGVKAVQAFQKETKKSETKGGLFEGKLLSQDEIKAIADLPSKEQLMAQIAGAINAVATKVAVGINEVPSGLARALKQHAEGGDS
jgi:large subunit ribosomal protein L10